MAWLISACNPLYRPGMERRRFLLTSLAVVLAPPLAAEAEQTKIARLGVLLFGTPDNDTDAFPAIRRGLPQEPHGFT
jgi:hypothetical protein